MSLNVFQNNVVIITGASRGIGEELARQLAEHGARLVLAARDEERLNAVAGICRAAGAQVLVVPTDVTDVRACENLIARTMKEFGRIDTLICNAGVGMWTRVDAVKDISIFDRVMRVNYLGAVYCTLAALPHLKNRSTQVPSPAGSEQSRRDGAARSPRGRIVLVSSLAGKTGVPERAGYSASKAAMNAFFDTLRIELEPFGVAITIALPDFVATGGRARNLGADGKPVVNPIPYGKDAMSTEKCARLILDGAAKGERETVMTIRGKVAPWVKLIAPGLVDRIAQRATARGH